VLEWVKHAESEKDPKVSDSKPDDRDHCSCCDLAGVQSNRSSVELGLQNLHPSLRSRLCVSQWTSPKMYFKKEIKKFGSRFSVEWYTEGRRRRQATADDLAHAVDYRRQRGLSPLLHARRLCGKHERRSPIADSTQTVGNTLRQLHVYRQATRQCLVCGSLLMSCRSVFLRVCDAFSTPFRHRLPLRHSQT
jgi:hypothetical protein